MNKEDLGNICNKYSERNCFFFFFLIALKRKHTQMLIKKWKSGQMRCPASLQQNRKYKK